MTAYKRLLRGLLDANVSFLVVGGYAAIGRHKDLADVESLKHFHKLPSDGAHED